MEETVAVEFKEKPSVLSKLFPLSLTIVAFALDQITKLLVIKFIPKFSVGASFFGDFLQFWHVSNTGAAFSLGSGFSGIMRTVLLAVLPLIVLGIVIVIYFRNNEFTKLQRWMISGILGGGLGNLFDRFFRKEGVVDFISVKFYGLFGLERWPTFNLADSFILVCGIILMITFLHSIYLESKKEKEDK